MRISFNEFGVSVAPYVQNQQLWFNNCYICFPGSLYSGKVRLFFFVYFSHD